MAWAVLSLSLSEGGETDPQSRSNGSVLNRCGQRMVDAHCLSCLSDSRSLAVAIQAITRIVKNDMQMIDQQQIPLSPLAVILITKSKDTLLKQFPTNICCRSFSSLINVTANQQTKN